MYSDTVIEDAKRRIDLRDYLGRYTTLKLVARHGDDAEWAGPCPVCGGHDRLHVKRHRAFCRHCHGEKWQNAIDITMWLNNLPFKEAMQRLSGYTQPPAATHAAPPASSADPAVWQKQARQRLVAAQQLLNGAQGEPARAYLLGRGLLPDTWAAWGLGYEPCPNGRNQPAIAIPYRQAGGTLWAIKYRYLKPEPDGPKTRFEKGSRAMLLGEHLLAGRPALIACEGDLNALSLWQVAREQADIICFGSESPGRTALDTLARLAECYAQRVVWCDRAEVAERLMLELRTGAGVRSPEVAGRKLDANELLQRGQLDLMLRKTLAALLQAEGSAAAGPADDAIERAAAGDRAAIAGLVKAWCAPKAGAPRVDDTPTIQRLWPAGAQPVCAGRAGRWQETESGAIRAAYTPAEFAWCMVAQHGTPAALRQLAAGYHPPFAGGGLTGAQAAPPTPVALERPYAGADGAWHVLGWDYTLACWQGEEGNDER